MNTLKAIIFDMDGTLADTEEVHRQAFNRAFSEFDLEWRWSHEDYKRLLLISGGKERISHCLQEANTNIGEHRTLEQLAKSIHQRKSTIYREMLIDGKTPLRPGVERLIKESVEQNITLAIATSSSRKNVETLITNNLGADALALFSVIVTCDTVVDKKPSPAVYQHALSELKLLPSDCIVIEDTCNGHLAALNAGLQTLITIHEYTKEDDFTGASLVLNELGEPDTPFTTYAGNTHGHKYVDVDLLQLLHSAYDSKSTSPQNFALANK